ncbi:MAG: signal peptidase II [Archangium sp.]|nr:signal peptidase II [Archangium sp.]
MTVLSVAIDQATKVWATSALKGVAPTSYLGDIFRLQWVTNDGAFLSLGASLPDALRFALLTVGVGGLLLGISIYTMLGKDIDGPQVIGYALIVSGGASNWVDRARFGGAVVDFMNVGIGTVLRSGVFNVADLAILAGIGLLMVHGWKLERAQKAAAASAPASAPPLS